MTVETHMNVKHMWSSYQLLNYIKRSSISNNTMISHKKPIIKNLQDVFQTQVWNSYKMWNSYKTCSRHKSLQDIFQTKMWDSYKMYFKLKDRDYKMYARNAYQIYNLIRCISNPNIEFIYKTYSRHKCRIHITCVIR